MCHLDTAQCRILKDSGRFLVKIPTGLGLMNNLIRCHNGKCDYKMEQHELLSEAYNKIHMLPKYRTQGAQKPQNLSKFAP